MPVKTIDEVIGSLEQIIQESKINESSLGYFAALYHTVTITVKGRLNSNYFDDDARMESLDVVFANRYLTAFNDYKNGNPITESWNYAFQSSKDNSLIVLQHLLLGMNAHINLDLGIAAAEISDKDSLDDLEADFNKINEILSSLVDEVQRDLAEIWPTLLKILKYLNKVDDFIIDFSMKIARDQAWLFAKSLVGAGSQESKDLIKEKDNKVLALSSRITHLGFLLKIIFKIIRIGERGKPSDKIKALESLMKNKLHSA